MKTISLYHLLTGCSILITLLINCNDGSTQKDKVINDQKKEVAIIPKPPSAFTDTIIIASPAAVIYQPDSLQIEKFRKQTTNMVYESTTHEGFFQMRNSRIVLKKYWPQLRIIEATHCRYLLFKKKDGTITCIDLNSNGNLYGLYMFNTIKEPVFADMMNIETSLGFYFK